MKILLTTSAAPEKSPFSTDEKRHPLGVGFLISLLRANGHSVFFIDNYLSPSNFIEEEYLQKNNIDFVGIYANTICYKDTLRMFKKIEDLRNKNCWKGKIIVGGPHTTVALNTIPDYVDYVVQGEGENAILKIVSGKIKKRVIKNDRIKNLDSLPFQPWDIFSKLPYDLTCPWMDIEPVFTMNTSRGCPFKCAFCSVDSIWGPKYTFFSADRIIAEIEYLIKNFEAKGIYFREDHFTLSKERTEDFCRKLIEKKIDIGWACETRVDTLQDEEIIKFMATAGCKAVYLGVESGSQNVLNILNKGISVSQIERTINLCKKYHIRTYCSLITGVPGETYKDYLKTKKMMERLQPFAYSFNVFVGIPSSTLYNYVLKNELYEYKDNLGLLYLPGYDVRAKYFYNLDNKVLVNYDFKDRTEFDEILLRAIKREELKRSIYRTISSHIPGPVKNLLKVFKMFFVSHVMVKK